MAPSGGLPKASCSAGGRLLSSIFTLNTPIVLSIRANTESIRWFITTHPSHHPQIKQIVYSLYPSAQIEELPAQEMDIGYRLYHFETALPGSLPVLYAYDLRDFDPLALFVGVMTNLESDEEVVYELQLNQEPTQEYINWSVQALYKSNVKFFHYLTNAGMDMAMQAKATGADMEMQYGDVAEQAIAEKIAEKINSALRHVNLAIKIRSSSIDRARELLSRFSGAIEQYSRDQVNLFGLAQDKLFPLVLCPAEAAGLWHFPTQDCQASGIVWSDSLATPLPNKLLVPDFLNKPGIKIGENKFQGNTNNVQLNYADRLSHVYVLGKSGFGKSTLFHNMIHQDIENGHGVGVIDPHGDLITDVLESSIPKERINDVVLFDAADREFPIGMNLMSVPPEIPIEEAAGLVMDMVKKMFAGDWSEGQMDQAMYAAVSTLSSNSNSTILDVQRLFSDESFRYKATKNISDFVVKQFWMTFESLSDGRKTEMARPLFNRLPRLYRNPVLRNIICQDRNLDIRQLIDERKIILCSLRGLPETELNTLGTLLVSKFEMAAMSRGNVAREHRKMFYLYIDEVQNFVSTSLPKVFREARKFGLSMTVGNQILGDLASSADAIIGNIGATLMFQLQRRDARELAMSMGAVNAEDLERLNKYQVVAKMQADGQSLAPFGMTTFDRPERQPYADEFITYIRDKSRERYGRHKDEVEERLWKLLNSDSPTKPQSDVAEEKNSNESQQPNDAFDEQTNNLGEDRDEFAG